MKVGLYNLYKKIRNSYLLVAGLAVVVMVVPVCVAKQQRPVVQQQQLVQKPIVKQELVQQPAVERLVDEQPEKQQFTGAKLSLEQIHSLQDSVAATMRSGKVLPATKVTSDRFTQSQAHMSLPEIKKIIASKYNIKPYEDMLVSMMNREKEFKDDYYVFYHGMKNIWRIPQDLYTRLYFYFKKLPSDLMKSFVFLRFENVEAPSSVHSFLVNTLESNGLINDHLLSSFLYSVNLAIFGNVGTDPECTWQYFVKSRGVSAPDRTTYEKIMDAFGLSYEYIDALMALVALYTTPEQTIVQIFIPKNKVDEIGYLSWIRGIPAHKRTMDLVLRSVEDKIFSKSPLALDYYTAVFKHEQESNPVFKSLLERVNAGDFSLGYFLQFYRNHPEAIEGINNFQARLIFTPELLLNPLSGVRIFRYSAATPEQMRNYEQHFDAIFKKIIAEKEAG